MNANPDTTISCADLLLGYGPWLDPAMCGERSQLPGHNSSYKRLILLQYGADLEKMLEAETLLQWDMRSKGHRLYQSGCHRTRHTNFSLLRPFAEACFANGRAFGAARARHWSIGRRAIFALASPLIPGVRLFKIVRDAKASPDTSHSNSQGVARRWCSGLHWMGSVRCSAMPWVPGTRPGASKT